MPELTSITRMPIFKVGMHKDNAGNVRDWTHEDLDAVIRNFSADDWRPAVVLGHPKMDDPRYGDFQRVYKEGGVLYADVGIIPELHSRLKAGQYPDRSVKMQRLADGTYRIRHVGLLGVTPPAVKGLPAYHFQDGDDAVTVEFSEEYKHSIVGRLMQRIRELIIDKFDTETADKVISPWEIEELQRQEQPGSTAPAFTEPTTKEEDAVSKELEDKLKAEQQKTVEFAEKATATAAENEQLKKQLAEERRKTQRAEFTEFVGGLMKEGKVTPAMQPAVLDFMEILSGVETFEFAEGDKTAAAKPIDKFKAMLKGLPQQVSFSEHATKEKVPAVAVTGTAADKLDQLTRQKMSANKDLSYNAAFSEAQRENTELAAEYAAELKA